MRGRHVAGRAGHRLEMQGGIGQPLLMRLQYAGMTAETGAFRSLLERADRNRFHGMRAVAAGADRRITVLGGQARLGMHAAEIGGVDVGVALLAGRLVDARGRAFDHGMRVMAVGADRGRRIAGAHQCGMNAGLPLLELVGVAVLAKLGCGDGKAARALDLVFGRRMRGGIDVGVAASTADGLVHGLYEQIGRHVQMKRVAVLQLLVHAGGAVTTETLLVGRRGRVIGRESARRCGRQEKEAGSERYDRSTLAQERAGYFAHCESSGHHLPPGSHFGSNIIRGVLHPPEDRPSLDAPAAYWRGLH